MYIYRKGTNVIIWGCGNIGRKIYEKYKNYFNVVGFIDRDDSKNTFFGLPVYKPSEVKNNAKIVVAVANNKDIVDYLNTKGFEIVKDYITYEYVQVDEYPVRSDAEEKALRQYKFNNDNRKKVFVVANCQSAVIKGFLKKNSEFNEKFLLIDAPAIQHIKDEEFARKCLEKADVIITQNIFVRRNNILKLFETPNIKNLYSSKRIIVIPNLFFDLYFFQSSTVNRFNKCSEQFPYGTQPYGDMIIDDLCSRYPKGMVEQLVNSEEIFGVSLFERLYKNRYDDLVSRDSACDFIMYDFIFNNFRNKKLFYTLNHPTNACIKELVIRLLKILNIESDFFEDEENITKLNAHETIIYPVTYKMYNLQFINNLYDQVGDIRLSFDEAVDKYIEDSQLYG